MRRGRRLVGYTRRQVCGECGAECQVTIEPGERATWDYPGSPPAVGAWGCKHAEAMLGEWAPEALMREAVDRQVEAAEAAVEAAIDRLREDSGREGDGRRHGTRGDRWDE